MDTLSTLRTGVTGISFDTLDTLNTLRALWPGVALDALRSLRSCLTLRSSNRACIKPCGTGPVDAVTFQTTRTAGSVWRCWVIYRENPHITGCRCGDCLNVSPCVSTLDDDAGTVSALRTCRTERTLWTYWTLCSGFALRSYQTLRSCSTSRTGNALRSLLTLDACGSCRPLCTLRSGCACRACWSFRTFGTGCTGCASIASFTLNTLRTYWTLRSFNALRPSDSAYVRPLSTVPEKAIASESTRCRVIRIVWCCRIISRENPHIPNVGAWNC